MTIPAIDNSWLTRTQTFSKTDNPQKNNSTEGSSAVSNNTQTDQSKKYNKKDLYMSAAAAVAITSLAGAGILMGKTRTIRSLRRQNADIQRELTNARNHFNDLFGSTDINPPEIREQIYQRLKSVIENKELNYDITQPPSKNGTTRNPNVTFNLVELPKQVKTENRQHNITLNIPEISWDGHFEIRIAESPEMRVTKCPTRDIPRLKEQPTSISDDYAESVRWNNDKIARDILQNFYDGHGQTLDGVQIISIPTQDGKFKIKILGKSTYSLDKAILLGVSSKRDDVHAAGNYGEGLKMSVLKLLKDKGCSHVKIGSDNWELDYKFLQSSIATDKKVLSYDVEPVTKYDGNFLEFETTDKDMIEALRRSINRFYHSGNEHFKCPDFENSHIGIKILPKEEKGGIYIAGQRFEFDGGFDNFNGAVIFVKEKLPPSVLDPSRDRTTLNKSNLRDIGYWLAGNDEIKMDDKLAILKSLEQYWQTTSAKELEGIDGLANGFIRGLYIHFHNLKIKFDDKYIASSLASPDVMMDLMNRGYVICKPDMHDLGMKNIHEVVNKGRAHTSLTPTPKQLTKIKILKEALMKFRESLHGKHFSDSELDAKIYLFDRKNAEEAKLYDDTLAEAIVENRTSKGFWIDRTYLESADFSELLETALHELCHKVGGDESATFSYELTNVNKKAIEQILNNNETRAELQALSRLWRETT